MPRYASPSEMIINPDGSVYHLQLQPQNIAHTIITVGDPSRVEMVSKYFDKIDFKAKKREFVTHTGRIGQKELTVMSTGIGPDNIDIVMNELDMVVNMDFDTRTRKAHHQALEIIRLGTSGALQPDIPVDSILLSASAFGLDNMMHFYRFTSLEETLAMQDALQKHCGFPEMIKPYFFSASQDLLNRFGTEIAHGTTLTAPGFYGPQGRQIHAPLHFPDMLDTIGTFRYGATRITNIEMESAAIFGLSELLGHQAISLNVILANRPNKQFSTNSSAAVDHLIKTALETIVDWPSPI